MFPKKPKPMLVPSTVKQPKDLIPTSSSTHTPNTQLLNRKSESMTPTLESTKRLAAIVDGMLDPLPGAQNDFLLDFDQPPNAYDIDRSLTGDELFEEVLNAVLHQSTLGYVRYMVLSF